MIQRDKYDLLDGMLVAINANDKLMFNMQNNVIALAAEKNMGVIGMKVFADGAMYTKPAEWSNKVEHVVRTVGDPNLPGKPLIQYALTTPGVHTVIIGIGQISDKYELCQLSNNFDAAQILPDGLSDSERTAIEEMAKKVKEGKTNYFQLPFMGLTAPKDVVVNQMLENNARVAVLGWSTAYAADAPLKSYEIWRDDNKVGEMPYTQQLTTDLHKWSDTVGDREAHKYIVRVIDSKGNVAQSAEVALEKA
jgi:predicted aldo/keto reductase-like oxidoreductase